MKPHRTDAVSLVFGIIFVAMAGWWGLSRITHIGLPALGWSVAIGLIVLGLVGLLAGLRGGPRRDTAQIDQPDEQ